MGLKEPGLRGSLRNVSVGIGAPPDSVVSQYDPREESTGSLSSITDQLGFAELTGSCSVIDDGINSNRSFRFDGTEFVDHTTTYSSNQKYAVVYALQQQEPPDSNAFYCDGGNDLEYSLQDNDDTEYRMRRRDDGSHLVDSSGVTVDQEPHVFVLEAFETGRVRVERDGTDIIDDEDGEINDLTGLTIGSRFDGNTPIEADLGIIGVLVDQSSDDVDQYRDFIANEYGITVN